MGVFLVLGLLIAAPALAENPVPAPAAAKSPAWCGTFFKQLVETQEAIDSQYENRAPTRLTEEHIQHLLMKVPSQSADLVFSGDSASEQQDRFVQTLRQNCQKLGMPAIVVDGSGDTISDKLFALYDAVHTAMPRVIAPLTRATFHVESLSDPRLAELFGIVESALRRMGSEPVLTPQRPIAFIIAHYQPIPGGDSRQGARTVEEERDRLTHSTDHHPDPFMHFLSFFEKNRATLDGEGKPLFHDGSIEAYNRLRFITLSIFPRNDWVHIGGGHNYFPVPPY